MTVIYQHPDGMGQIEFDAQAQHLIVRNDETNEVAHVVIGPEGLRELASELRDSYLEVAEENQRLLDEHAALVGGDEANSRIAELREEHRILALELDAVRKSRDFYKSENEQLKKQMYYVNQRREAAGMK